MLETFQFATSRLAGSLLIAMRKGSRNSSPRQFRHRRPASHDRHVKSRPRRMNAITAAADPGNQARRKGAPGLHLPASSEAATAATRQARMEQSRIKGLRGTRAHRRLRRTLPPASGCYAPGTSNQVKQWLRLVGSFQQLRTKNPKKRGRGWAPDLCEMHCE